MAKTPAAATAAAPLEIRFMPAGLLRFPKAFNPEPRHRSRAVDSWEINTTVMLNPQFHFFFA
jgi:hypothetical protein